MSSGVIEYIKVAEAKGANPTEVLCEEDGTILLTTLISIFPGATGLVYEDDETGEMHRLPVYHGKVLPAEGEDWPAVSIFYCTFDQDPNSAEHHHDLKCSDLIVRGLAGTTTEKILREYFKQVGPLLIVQVEHDRHSGMAKCGYIRFESYESQVAALSRRHLINGSWCDVAILPADVDLPEEYLDSLQELNRKKIFIGNLGDHITLDHLREYFGQYGDIEDIYIPRRFRGFAFLTFGELQQEQQKQEQEEQDLVKEEDEEESESSPPPTLLPLYGDHHIIKGCRAHVSLAIPKTSQEMNNNNNTALSSSFLPVDRSRQRYRLLRSSHRIQSANPYLSSRYKPFRMNRPTAGSPIAYSRLMMLNAQSHQPPPLSPSFASSGPQYPQFPVGPSPPPPMPQYPAAGNVYGPTTPTTPNNNNSQAITINPTYYTGYPTYY